MQPRLDPGAGIEQRFVTEARTNELYPERQAAAAVPGRQRQAGCPRQGPDRVEPHFASRTEPLWGFAHRAWRQQHIDLGEDVVELAAKRLGCLDRLDIGGER